MVCRDKNLRLEIIRMRYNEERLIAAIDQTESYICSVESNDAGIKEQNAKESTKDCQKVS